MIARAAELSPLAPAFWGACLVLLQLLGIASAFHALAHVRTAQGTIAWAIALISFPVLAVPLYWMFGSKRFQGYVETLRRAADENKDAIAEVIAALEPLHGDVDRKTHPCEYTLDILTRRRFTKGNRVDLLIDGAATFDAMFAAIDAARDYLIIQFFIIKDDEIGTRLKSKLISRARDGVRVFVLYDDIGSRKLGSAYLADLRSAGVQVSGFRPATLRVNPMRINFRNHRKIVIADGQVAFVGGHNIGDEYLGRSSRFGPWRDTHVRVEGPAVQGIQAIFVEDWFWATRTLPDLTWQPHVAPEGNLRVLPLETGPIDRIETCTLMFHHIIGSAKDRLWIASPYFVPDEGVENALQLAALRGVDVRILIPDVPDQRLVYLAGFSYLEAMEAAGVKMFRYARGFLHQKVALVDNHLSIVGTANLDNRSFRLNFELSIVVSSEAFAAQVAAMLETDLAHCRRIDATDYTGRGVGFRYAVRFARLLAPIL